MTTTETADGIWRAERETSGNWIATRYVLDPELNRAVHRERDTIFRNGLEIHNYFETMGPAEQRANELNKKRGKKAR